MQGINQNGKGKERKQAKKVKKQDGAKTKCEEGKNDGNISC